MENYTLNDEQVKKIIETEPRKIPETNVFNDLDLPKEERIKHAKELLEKWKESSDKKSE